MLSPLRDETVAMNKLKTLCAWDVEPVLTEDELQDILDAARIAQVWEPGLVVSPGQVIAPATRTGWLYAVTLSRDADRVPGGVTGDTEPDWPLDPRWPSWEPRKVDDGTARFVIHSRETAGLWDMKAAAHAAWMLKAAKASGEYASSLEGNGFHPEQVHDQCLRMAARYVPVRIR